MYLAPWQIFLGGCICGSLITFIILVLIVIRLATHAGVRIEHTQEDNDK